MRLGMILLKWRILSQMSVTQAANVIGISPSTLRRLEAGGIPPHGETLITLLQWLLSPEESNATGKDSGPPATAGAEQCSESVAAE